MTDTARLTVKQYHRLRMVSNAFVVCPDRRNWEPLLRRGLVRILGDTTRPGATWAPFIGITSDGYQALAILSERYGLPELPRRTQPSPGAVDNDQEVS